MTKVRTRKRATRSWIAIALIAFFTQMLSGLALGSEFNTSDLTVSEVNALDAPSSNSPTHGASIPVTMSGCHEQSDMAVELGSSTEYSEPSTSDTHSSHLCCCGADDCSMSGCNSTNAMNKALLELPAMTPTVTYNAFDTPPLLRSTQSLYRPPILA